MTEFSEKASSLSLLTMTLIWFFIDAFYQVKEVVQCFYHETVLNFVK